MIKGRTLIRDEPTRRLRGLMMLEHKVRHGATNAAIAKEFNVSENTVARTLSMARRAQLTVLAEDKILQDLMPAAHNAIKLALADTDHPIEAAKIALEIFKGMVPSFGKSKPGATTPGPDDLATYIANYRSGELVDGDTVPAGAIEGTTLPALPAAAESAAPQGPGESD